MRGGGRGGWGGVGGRGGGGGGQLLIGGASLGLCLFTENLEF